MLGGALVMLAVASAAASAQQRDTTRRDSTARRTPADSARIADSIAVVRRGKAGNSASGSDVAVSTDFTSSEPARRS